MLLPSQVILQWYERCRARRDRAAGRRHSGRAQIVDMARVGAERECLANYRLLPVSPMSPIVGKKGVRFR
jgi:hypothetical protein